MPRHEVGRAAQSTVRAGGTGLFADLQENKMTDTLTQSLSPRELRGANLCQILHWLAAGRIDARELCEAYLSAIAHENPHLNAYVHVNPAAREEASAADARRSGGVFGRLDGIPVSVKDNLDVAGLPTRCGMPAAAPLASADADVVARLRHAGAVILGKTH